MLSFRSQRLWGKGLILIWFSPLHLSSMHFKNHTKTHTHFHLEGELPQGSWLLEHSADIKKIINIFIFKIFNDSLILQIQILLLHLRFWTIYFISSHQCTLTSSITLTESNDFTILKGMMIIVFFTSLLSRDCLSSLFSHLNF